LNSRQPGNKVNKNFGPLLRMELNAKEPFGKKVPEIIFGKELEGTLETL